MTPPHPSDVQAANGTALQHARAYAVHVLTASGVVLAFLSAAELTRATPDVRWIFALLFAAVIIDAGDGYFARRWQVKRFAARIDGRTIDDLVDYLTYTFVPLLLMWRMGWLPEPGVLWVAPALVASLFGFANREAKDESAGFFLGWPSYWNVVAFYAGLFEGPVAARWTAATVLLLALLTVLPVRFLYPNLAPPAWRSTVIVGAAVWIGTLIAILVQYPAPPGWLIIVSLIYPGFYAVLSLYLDRSRVRTAGGKSGLL
jgi:phosphatidylcholine synthase